MLVEATVPRSPVMGKEEESEQETAIVRALVNKAKTGDVEAFEGLMILYQRRVLGIALRMLGNPDDAKDAAQEVFLRLFKRLSSLDPARRIAPWLYRVTINVCHDVGRRRRATAGVALNSRSMIPSSSWAACDDIEGSLILAEEWRFLQAGLAWLPKKERASLVLRDVEGLDTAEVAKILGTSAVTIRTHLSRGRLRLIKYIKQMLGRHRS